MLAEHSLGVYKYSIEIEFTIHHELYVTHPRPFTSSQPPLCSSGLQALGTSRFLVSL